MSVLRERVTEDLDRLFAATGRRCYVIGSLHGGFPNLGHHLPGEMGGVWVPPLKLADGFWFGISAGDNHGTTESEVEDNGSGGSETVWLHGSNCCSFTMQPGVVQREFRVRLAGVAIEVQQQILVPDEEPGLFVDLTLHNVSESNVELTLAWLVRWDIQGAWGSHWPDRPDEARFEHEWGGILAWDSGCPEWSGAMIADRAPDGYSSGPELWGPEQTSSLVGVEGARRGGI